MSQEEGRPYSTLQISEVFRRQLLLRRGKRREGRNKEKRGCMVQVRICHCCLNMVVTEIDP